MILDEKHITDLLNLPGNHELLLKYVTAYYATDTLKVEDAPIYSCKDGSHLIQLKVRLLADNSGVEVTKNELPLCQIPLSKLFNNSELPFPIVVDTPPEKAVETDPAEQEVAASTTKKVTTKKTTTKRSRKTK